MKPEKCKRCDIRMHPEMQPRFSMDTDHIDDLRQSMENGSFKFQEYPLVLHRIEKILYVVDGWHRMAAAARSGMDTVWAVITDSESVEKSAFIACAVNATNSLKRTNDDKRKCVERAIELRPDLSMNAIASHCGVSRHMVKNIENQSDSPGPRDQVSIIGMDGKSYTKSAMPKKITAEKKIGITFQTQHIANEEQCRAYLEKVRDSVEMLFPEVAREMFGIYN